MKSNKLIHELNMAQEQIETIKEFLLKNEEKNCLQTLHLLKVAHNALKKFGQFYAKQYLNESLKATISKEELEKDITETITSSFDF